MMVLTNELLRMWHISGMQTRGSAPRPRPPQVLANPNVISDAEVSTGAAAPARRQRV